MLYGYTKQGTRQCYSPVYHADLWGVYHTHRVGQMHECSTCELPTSAAFMRHENKVLSKLQ